MINEVCDASQSVKVRTKQSRSTAIVSPLRILLASTLALCSISHAAHSTDAEARDKLYERSAKVCTYHSRANTQPAVQSLSLAALDTVMKRKIIMCPNPKLGGRLAFVWYGEHNALAWNPDAQGAVEELSKKLDEMVKADDFPPGVEPWNVDGSRPKPGSSVPGIDYAVKEGVIWLDYDR
jgi:hypothetical protein